MAALNHPYREATPTPREHYRVRLTPFLSLVLATIVLACVLVLAPAVAHADPLPVVSPGNPNSPALIGWLMLGYLLDSCILRALSPDNTTLPFAPSVTTLHWINLVGALLQSIAVATFGGQPWYAALSAGVLQFVLGLTHVGAAAGQKTKNAEAAVVAQTASRVSSTTIKPPPPTPPAAA